VTKGTDMTVSSDAPSIGTSRRGHGGLIFLMAMGLALATSGGAILSAVGTGGLQHAIQHIGVFRTADIVAEQRRQSETVAQLEDSLRSLMGEVAMLKSREITKRVDVEERLSTLDAGLARLALDSATLRIARSDASGPSHEEVDELRTNLAMAGIEIGALRSSLDATQQAQQREFGNIAQRLERLERLVGDPDMTSSIATTPPRAHESLAGWSVRDARRGSARITGHGITYRVKRGTVVPGIGRVSGVRARGDRWIVVTEKGIIVQR
jgi:hypothetical protein